MFLNQIPHRAESYLIPSLMIWVMDPCIPSVNVQTTQTGKEWLLLQRFVLPTRGTLAEGEMGCQKPNVA